MTFRTFRSLYPRAFASFLVSSAILGIGVAHADPAAADLVAAKQAFESAVSLEAERDWKVAALKLRQAIAIKDTPGLRFHLAHCEAEQGHLVEASLEYDRASALLRQGAKAPDVQKLLGPASEALKLRLPRLTVDLPPDLGSPSAALDGRPYPPSELALGVPLNPGRHVLRVAAPNRRPFEQVIILDEGQHESVRPQLALAPPPITPPAPVVQSARTSPTPPPAPTSDGHSSAKLYLLIGESVLTVAGLSVGIGGQLSASSASDRVASAQRRIDGVASGDGSACNRAELIGACRDLHSAISAHDNATIISEVGFIGAGVAAAALITTWLVYPNSNSNVSAVRVHPVAGFGSVGLAGSF